MPVLRPALCLWLLLVAITTLPSQSLSPTVIASAGDTYSHPTASISFTVGELAAVATEISPEAIFTQGFQQPWEIMTSVEVDVPTGAFLIFPNPTYGDFTIMLPDDIQGEVSVRLVDAFGRILFDKRYDSTSPMNISTKNVAQGLYWIQIVPANHHDASSFVYTQKISIVK